MAKKGREIEEEARKVEDKLARLHRLGEDLKASLALSGAAMRSLTHNADVSCLATLDAALVALEQVIVAVSPRESDDTLDSE